jgi:tetraacyldisaccharide 4'-kinase
MPDDILIRILLLPISLLYGLGVGLRNLLYRFRLLKSVSFSMPVISVGNMSVGGTGKSPHIEYLLRWLDLYLDVAVLSRGYGRKTEGFRTVLTTDTADLVGDEPLQFKRKFPQIPISVGESRAFGVPEVVKRNPETQVVLLDDAFQHLSVRPGLNILLTEFSKPFMRDWLLPSGRLREWRVGYRRADIIIVTKCPMDISTAQKQAFLHELDPYNWQRVYFSNYQYGTPYDLLRPDIKMPLTLATDVLLLSAIANTDYLIDHLRNEVKSLHTLEFEDHHFYSDEDLQQLLRRFAAIDSKNKVILTTEKDAMRLEMLANFFRKNNLPVFVLPIQVDFLEKDEALFKEDLKNFLLEFKS